MYATFKGKILNRNELRLITLDLSLVWLIDECQIAFFMSCLMLGNLDPLFLVIFFVICLTVHNLSGILDTTDTSYMQPWLYYWFFSCDDLSLEFTLLFPK